MNKIFQSGLKTRYIEANKQYDKDNTFIKYILRGCRIKKLNTEYILYNIKNE